MVPPFERFRNPPITEAIIEILCRLDPSIGLGKLSQIYQEIGSSYPKMDLAGMLVAVPPIPGVPPGSLQMRPIGYRLDSADGQQVVQARINGFSFSRLPPYDRWETFSAEALRIWDIYRNLARPAQVTRIGVRFVNRVNLPIGEDLAQYIQIRPELGPTMPQQVRGYLMQIVLDGDDANTGVNVTQTIQKDSEDGSSVPLIFDIDAFRSEAFAPDSGKILSTLEQLRALKNRLFFGSITDKLKERFR